MLMIHVSRFDNINAIGDYIIDKKFKFYKTAYEYLIKKGFTEDKPGSMDFSRGTDNGPEWATICEVVRE